MARGRVVGRQRRGEPALGPVAGALLQRLARDQRRAGARFGRPDRRVQAGGTRSRPRRHRPRMWGACRRTSARVPYLGRGRSLLQPSLLTRPRDRSASRERRADPGDRGDAGGGGLAGTGASAARRRRRGSSLQRAHEPRTDRHGRTARRGRRRHDRPRDRGLGGLVGGGADGRRGRLRGGRPAARRRRAVCVQRPAAAGPSLRARHARWASACSTMSPSPPSRRWPQGVERVLILDWDVHHGNGTEEIFSDRRRRALLRASTSRRCIRGPGPPRSRGRGAGEGYTVNLPVPPGSGSEQFLALVQHVVAPIARSVRARG